MGEKWININIKDDWLRVAAEIKRKEGRRKVSTFQKIQRGEIDPTDLLLRKSTQKSIVLLFIDLFLEPERILQVYQKKSS